MLSTQIDLEWWKLATEL